MLIRWVFKGIKKMEANCWLFFLRFSVADTKVTNLLIGHKSLNFIYIGENMLDRGVFKLLVSEISY